MVVEALELSGDTVSTTCLAFWIAGAQRYGCTLPGGFFAQGK
jgi:hypothetical protein